MLGASVSKRRPDLVHAYVSIGQLVEWEGNFLETKRLLEERARTTNDTVLRRSLPPSARRLLPPTPKRDGAWIDKVRYSREPARILVAQRSGRA